MPPWHKTSGESVTIVVRRLYISYLEEGPRTEHTVLVTLKNAPMPLGCSERFDRQNGGRRPTELRTEVTTIRLKCVDDRRGCSESYVEFFQRVIVDKIELDILIAAALSRGSVLLARAGSIRCAFDSRLIQSLPASPSPAAAVVAARAPR